MRKLLAVVKREYVQRVRSKFFVVATIFGPVMMVGFTILPPLMSGIRSGGPTRLAIVDQTGKMYERVARELTNGREPNRSSRPPVGTTNSREQVDQASRLFQRSFLVEEVPLDNRSLEQIRDQLESRVQAKDLEGYIVLRPNLLNDEPPEFRARNAADLLTQSYVQDAISRAVRGQRLVEAGIKETDVERASEPISLRVTKAGGVQSKGQASSYFVFGTGLLIYLCVLLYGQLVLGAVIDEKETRIAELLFSSMRSFPLMMGKLIGVSLVALTQLSIWGLAFLLFALFGVGMLAAQGVPISLPQIPAIVFVYFVIYFLLGYFIYATLYAVVGSMVTTTQEGGQLALPVVLMLVAGFYLSFSIMRNPNSPLAFWASLFPFFAPITMLARIVTETPPLWQIILSLGIGVATAVGLIWLASRIYRVGMLMTGKKASIPEVWRWLRQS